MISIYCARAKRPLPSAEEWAFYCALCCHRQVRINLEFERGPRLELAGCHRPNALAVLTWQAAISHGVYARHLQGNAASTDAPSFAGAFCGAVRMGVEIAARLGASSRL